MWRWFWVWPQRWRFRFRSWLHDMVARRQVLFCWRRDEIKNTWLDLATFNVKIFYIMKNKSIMKNLPRRRFLLYWCHLLSFCYAGPKAVKLAKIQHKLFWKHSWFSSQVVFRIIFRPCLYVQLFYLSQNENMWPCVRRLAVPALFFFIVTSPVENMETVHSV